MGIYVNPGNKTFKEASNSMIYVDKSELIAYTNCVINTNQKIYAPAAPAVSESPWPPICL